MKGGKLILADQASKGFAIIRIEIYRYIQKMVGENLTVIGRITGNIFQIKTVNPYQIHIFYLKSGAGLWNDHRDLSQRRHGSRQIMAGNAKPPVYDRRKLPAQH